MRLIALNFVGYGRHISWRPRPFVASFVIPPLRDTQGQIAHHRARLSAIPFAILVVIFPFSLRIRDSGGMRNGVNGLIYESSPGAETCDVVAGGAQLCQDMARGEHAHSASTHRHLFKNCHRFPDDKYERCLATPLLLTRAPINKVWFLAGVLSGQLA